MKGWLNKVATGCAAVAVMAFGLSAPAAARQVELNLDVGQEALVAGATQRLFIKVGLQGIRVPERRDRAPINVALVLDRSGSMSGDKIENAREAAATALDYLGERDTLALVTYDHRVEVPVAAQRLRDKQAVRRAIREIEPGGNTALFAGVSKGAAELKRFLDRERINRLVLISDGLANVGPSSPEELGRLGRDLGGQGISVTTIGLGLGYNEDLMVRLAGASDGNHVFVEEPAQLAEVFRKEFGELGSVVAQQVTITIHCGKGVRPIRILGREGRVYDDRVEVGINQLYAEQERYLILEVEVTPGEPGAEREVARVELGYDDLSTQSRATESSIAKVRYTASREEAEGSVKKEVMVDASTQVGAAMDDEALTLRDKGDVRGAQEVYQRKAEFLKDQAAKYDSEALEAQAARSSEAEAAVAAPAADWGKARKAIRADQYSTQKQQSYK